MYDGMICVYKEKGYTSHDVVARLRGILHQKKIGHTGTLDPDAEGVLPVCLGKGTKLCDMLTDHDKEYRAMMKLGITTDTQDKSGRIISERNVEVNEADIRAAAESFTGEYMQVPPMYSAIKIGGKKLYELARKGQEIKRPERKVFINSLTVDDISLPYVSLTVSCSKGTYIRTLCHDIGGKLGCGACMTELIRTRVGRFSLKEAVKLSEIEDAAGHDGLDSLLIPLETMLLHLPALTVTDEYADKLLLNGNKLGRDQLTASEHIEEDRIRADEGCRIYSLEGKLSAVYSYDESADSFKNIKMFI